MESYKLTQVLADAGDPLYYGKSLLKALNCSIYKIKEHVLNNDSFVIKLKGESSFKACLIRCNSRETAGTD